MKKCIWISLVVFLMAGCGSRTRNLQQETSRTETESVASGSANVSVKNSTTGEMTLADFLENRNLKITSNGSPYSLQYSGLILTGAADLEFSESKQERKLLYKYIVQTIYQSQTTYYRHTDYVTQTTFRTVDVQRAGLSFGNMIWIIVAAFIAGSVAWPLLKQYVPIWFRKIFKRK
ncbi:hypothetical protein FY557_17440 [Chryseobacterium sp. SN22]|uniref:hypothetical protein n=1 Tax=Chryseobacterium sp. SN22 TaxID=2606431 RepID=UPI0011EF8358|nr:hypothetical protein [Chryseobacterium sp. SN22]KAA0126434.1 hypothetical protein FY557_17440 [Chryseobacterium sp. SN22]